MTLFSSNDNNYFISIQNILSMNMEPTTKKKYALNHVRKLARRYQTKINAAYREIDEHVRSGRSGKVTTPNYAREVIAPLTCALAVRYRRLLPAPDRRAHDRGILVSRP